MHVISLSCNNDVVLLALPAGWWRENNLGFDESFRSGLLALNLQHTSKYSSYFLR